MSTIKTDDVSLEPNIAAAVVAPRRSAEPAPPGREPSLADGLSSPDAPAAGDSTTIRRSNGATKPYYKGRVNGRVRFPDQRAEGNRSYLVQLMKTSVPLALGDLAVLTLAVAICALIGLDYRLGQDEPVMVMLRSFVPTVIGLWALNAMVGLYPAVRLGFVEEMKRLTIALTVLFVITITRYSLSSDIVGFRLAFAFATYALCLLLMPLGRKWLRSVLARTSWWGFPTLVCGYDAAAVSVYQWLNDHRRIGLRPLGFVADPHSLEVDKSTTGYLGDWSEARGIAERGHAYWATIVESPHHDADVAKAIEQDLGNVPLVLVLSEGRGMPDHWNRHQMDEGLDGLLVEQHLMLPVQQLVKRGMDLVISALTGVILVPTFIGLAVAIKLTSRGPIFYGHERIGRGNTRFKAWKFRTMVADADKVLHNYLAQHPELQAEWDRDHKLKNDPRVTRLGNFLRKWSIDELPQVWNVVRGEMSVVGPRPIVEAEIPKYGEHFEIFCSVTPGITGLWQVCGRNDTTYEERTRLDIYYIHHWSPWLDLYLLARTVKTVLFSKGAY
jgi:Undecaprenyl-phosphate galactose phosphotransferase WbaP